MNFSDRFSDLLGNNPLNQKELSISLNISEGALINYKRGRIPKAEELLKIANHFGVSMEWLLTGKDDSPKSESAWKTRCQIAETKLAIAKEALQAVLKKLD